MKKPKSSGRIICPDKNGTIKGEPLCRIMALPFHLINKKCKKCGKPAAEHGLFIQKGN